MPIFYIQPICSPTPPPVDKCYNSICFKTGGDFSGWTVNGLPFNATNLGTAVGGGGYMYTGASITPTPPPTAQGQGAIGWTMLLPTDPKPVVVVKDNLGNIIPSNWVECCVAECYEIFVPKTSARLNVITFHRCQIEFVNYAIQIDAPGTEAAIAAILAQIYPASASVTIQSTALGKTIKLKNLYMCGSKVQVIDDNNNGFLGTIVPC